MATALSAIQLRRAFPSKRAHIQTGSLEARNMFTLTTSAYCAVYVTSGWGLFGGRQTAHRFDSLWWVLLRECMQSSILIHFVSNIESAWFHHIFADYINMHFFKYLAYLNLNILLLSLSLNCKCWWASLFCLVVFEEIIIKEMHIF